MNLASRCTVVLASWVLVTGSPQPASQAVQFQDGRVLQVASVEVKEPFLVLSLEGGGVISVPAWRVSGWQEVPDEPPNGSLGAGVATADPDAWRRAAGSFAGHIEKAAREHRVDPALLTAMARTESAFDPHAVSPKGAQGLMQLMPQTALRFGVTDVFDVSQNVDGGARYLSWLLDRFEGSTELALAGYNAGEGAVERYNGIPPYPETEDYVVKVLREAARLNQGSPSSSPSGRPASKRANLSVTD